MFFLNKRKLGKLNQYDSQKEFIFLLGIWQRKLF